MKTILITTDFSAASINAANYGAALAQQLDAEKIILYHTIDEKSKKLASNNDYTTLTKQLTDITDALAAVNNNTAYETVINASPLLKGVKELIQQHKVALLIAGTIGNSTEKKILIGSNTIALADEIHLPFLIVPSHAKFETGSKVIFACDLKKVAKTTPVATIEKIKNAFQANLTVLNVAKTGTAYNPNISQEQYVLHNLLDHLHPSYQYIEADNIAESINQFAVAENARMVISIPKTDGFWGSLFRQSVSVKLASKAAIPLLLLQENK